MNQRKPAKRTLANQTFATRVKTLPKLSSRATTRTGWGSARVIAMVAGEDGAGGISTGGRVADLLGSGMVLDGEEGIGAGLWCYFFHRSVWILDGPSFRLANVTNRRAWLFPGTLT